jgi:hypothetical protein
LPSIVTAHAFRVLTPEDDSDSAIGRRRSERSELPFCPERMRNITETAEITHQGENREHWGGMRGGTVKKK